MRGKSRSLLAAVFFVVCALAGVRTGENAYYWWIFPNLMINLYQGVNVACYSLLAVGVSAS